MTARRALRRNPGGTIRRWVLVLAALASLSAVGCTMGPPPARDVTVRGVTAAGEAVRVRPVELWDPFWELLYVKVDEEDGGEDVPSRGDPYAVRMVPGQLMVVQFGWDKKEDAVLYPWVYRGELDEPLAMDHDGPALRINGRVAALDLSHAGT
ncbi:MAG: hypothetical protein GX591_16215, partial [Planctomycetes bacterium]|nr:hypothetical protein [Planctomycetota bacterium]